MRSLDEKGVALATATTSATATGADGDGALVEALRARDEATFAALVDAWSGSMMRVARAYVSTDSSAEEVVQDTWLAVLKGLAGFRAQSSLRTWVYRILVNQAKARGVRDHRVVPTADLTLESAGNPAVDPSCFQGPDDRYPGGWRVFPASWPEQAVLSREIRTVVRVALSTLPPRQRAVVTLRDVEGLTSAEVSDLLDLSTGNQRVLLHRGRSVVRAHLERYLAASPVGDQASR
jgi:RNA polymerase sigma-70 factor, ECF subfamily